jgi:hypothetical protein
MPAIHDRFTRQMSDRLKTTGMGLGLVRLLQRAGRIEEARTTPELDPSSVRDASRKPGRH